MFTIEYNGYKVGLLIGNNHEYRFKTAEEAKSKIDIAEKFSVQYPHNRWADLENSVPNRKQLKIKYDGFMYDEL
ncbi:MAG: hypothetical protein R2879_20815 [Saprospiraceae bacterium]